VQFRTLRGDYRRTTDPRGGGGFFFRSTPHRDMEIRDLRAGRALGAQDSMGNGSVIQARRRALHDAGQAGPTASFNGFKDGACFTLYQI